MKKILVSMFLLVFGLCLVGCNNFGISNIPSSDSILITKYDNAQEIQTIIVEEFEVGKIYTGKVVKTSKFGAFVEVCPNKEGMIHISKLAKERVEKVEDVVKVGDAVTVKVIEIDEQGRVNMMRIVED